MMLPHLPQMICYDAHTTSVLTLDWIIFQERVVDYEEVDRIVVRDRAGIDDRLSGNRMPTGANRRANGSAYRGTNYGTNGKAY